MQCRSVFFFQAEDGIRDGRVTGVQTCALPIFEHVETHDDVFISSDQAKGGYRPNIPADPAILGIDNPLHAKRRKLVSRRFKIGRASCRERAWVPGAAGSLEEKKRKDRRGAQ